LTVEALLASRADVDHADSHGVTALYCAAGFGDLATAEVLLGGGAAVDKAITRSYGIGATDAVNVYLAGVTPLMIAALFGHPAICTRLLAARADVRVRSQRPVVLEPIHWAACQGRGCGAPESTVPVLVAAGADVNSSVDTMPRLLDRMTPLHWAAWYNNAAEIEELLACGADLSLRCRFLPTAGDTT
jgi:ankyrin repeat protein